MMSRENFHSHGVGQTWIKEEGNLKVVKLSESLTSVMKKEVSDSFVATVLHLGIYEKEIQNW